jgi:hypothetical protein
VFAERQHGLRIRPAEAAADDIGSMADAAMTLADLMTDLPAR